jgi:hypothetical protein
MSIKGPSSKDPAGKEEPVKPSTPKDSKETEVAQRALTVQPPRSVGFPLEVKHVASKAQRLNIPEEKLKEMEAKYNSLSDEEKEALLKNYYEKIVMKGEKSASMMRLTIQNFPEEKMYHVFKALDLLEKEEAALELVEEDSIKAPSEVTSGEGTLSPVSSQLYLKPEEDPFTSQDSSRTISPELSEVEETHFANKQEESSLWNLLIPATAALAIAAIVVSRRS